MVHYFYGIFNFKLFSYFFTCLVMFKTVLAQQHFSNFHLKHLDELWFKQLRRSILHSPSLSCAHLLKNHHVFARIMEQNEKRFWDLLRLNVRMTTCLPQLVWSVEKFFLNIQPTILQRTAKKGSDCTVKCDSRVRVSDGCASRWHW